jgi:two-component system osmolarity sensor histidine kinase EnvZ
VDLRDLIDGVVTRLRPAGAAIEWSPVACCYCPVDTLALQRVLTNLLENALRYSGDKPVSIHCHCEEATAVIQVLDRGRGIPEQERDKVFQPFHRLEGSRSRRTGGSGLGLAIVRQLCDVHGWDIRLLPRTGGGTEACLRIPLRQGDA